MGVLREWLGNFEKVILWIFNNGASTIWDIMGHVEDYANFVNPMAHERAHIYLLYCRR